ncbi:MAG: cysteine hydrolase [Thermoproteota archaeon]|nr:cysteine hydrolase [Thermoproteota archaeon]
MSKSKLTMEDILAVLSKPYPEFEVERGKTALLLIDMQKIVKTEVLFKEAVEAGLPEDEVRQVLKNYDTRIKRALANAQKLLTVCREKSFDIVHVKLEAPTEDPRHTAKINRKVGLIIPSGSMESEFFEEVRPIKGELVFTKTNGGAFTGTNVDFVLRNMGITSLIVCGFITDQCVLATVIQAADIGYDIILVDDGCTAFTREAHEAVINSLKDMCLKVKKTREILNLIRKIEATPS